MSVCTLNSAIPLPRPCRMQTLPRRFHPYRQVRKIDDGNRDRSPNTTGLGVTALGTSGLGTTGLGTTGLGSLPSPIQFDGANINILHQWRPNPRHRVPATSARHRNQYPDGAKSKRRHAQSGAESRRLDDRRGATPRRHRKRAGNCRRPARRRLRRCNSLSRQRCSTAKQNQDANHLLCLRSPAGWRSGGDAPILFSLDGGTASAGRTAAARGRRCRFTVKAMMCRSTCAASAR